MRQKKLTTFILTVIFISSGFSFSQSSITSPKEQFGFDIGADYHLVNYSQLLSYWEKLDRESERLTLTRIGTTAEGRPMIMAIITSPQNQKKLARYKEISRRLALAESLTDQQARMLAAEGRAVVQIDGGLHATEVLGSQQLIELVWQMVSQNDAETLRILDEVILLAIPSNPDGLELVANWYMREKDPLKRTTRYVPRLYQKYIGHDNNRDFYMITQPETEAISRVMYLEWFPQIVYNPHQTGPAGTVLFCSPFRDPFNYFFDPLVPTGIDLVGSAMHARFVAEGKPGATMRSGAGYSTWWSGGLRSTSYFHNMIGILTEAIGNPTPVEIPFLPEKQLPKNDLPFPIAPQKWPFHKSIEYSITADRAILDLAARMREHFLFNMFRMGKNSIERGSRDHWTISPKRIEAVEQAIKKDNVKPARVGFSRGYPTKYYDILRDPAARDPRGYIIPSDQADFLTATKFVNALIKSGVRVFRAAKPFEVAGKSYPENSYIIKCDQAFRPHILAMFEPQDHPHDVQYPGGPPIAPYDSAGWTLAFQMGVEFDRILDGFDGPFEKVNGLAKAPPGSFVAEPNHAGFLLDHRVNDSFIIINRLLKANEVVYWLKEPFQSNGKTYPTGTIFVPASETVHSRLKEWAGPLGLKVESTADSPQMEALWLRPVRIGLWDIYGGSMTSGWTRWLLEQYGFPFDVIFPPQLDAGNLAAKYDALIFPGGAIPSADREPEDEFRFWFAQPKPEDIPEEYRNRLGTVTVANTVPQLSQFLEAGGSILAIGSSTSLGFHLGLPIADVLIEKLTDGTQRPLPREKYYVPGSVLQTKVDNTIPLAYGMKENTDVYFNNSPVFSLHPAAASKNVRAVAWFDSPAPLRSGWAWGQNYLDKTVAVVEARVGKGWLFLFGPEIIFRGQPHGTFKFLFNGIYCGTAEPINLGEK
ncbi:MAG: M14 family metallopeptidase [Clostridiales bacterium]|nr:M14 family metallopeptidase [Clostridiales bacterium]